MIYRTKLKVPFPVLNNLYTCHVRACEAVSSPRGKARMVFHTCIDTTSTKGIIVLYTPEPVNDDSRPFLPSAPFTFMVRLNPVKNSGGKRVSILDRAEIERFVIDKLDPFNVDVSTLHISGRYEQRFTKPNGQIVTINTVLVRGETPYLPKNFETLLLKGIGREKAFGYGTFHLFERKN